METGTYEDAYESKNYRGGHDALDRRRRDGQEQVESRRCTDRIPDLEDRAHQLREHPRQERRTE
jgi:hypothetical protein